MYQLVYWFCAASGSEQSQSRRAIQVASAQDSKVWGVPRSSVALTGGGSGCSGGWTPAPCGHLPTKGRDAKLLLPGVSGWEMQ